MINWLRLVVSCASIICITNIFASTGVLPSQQDDPNGTCGELITKGNSNPPQGSVDQSTIDTIQSCLANCDQLYQSFADQNDYDDMNAGIAYCRINLTALYNQSLFLQANASLTPKNPSTRSSAVNQDSLEIPTEGTEPSPQPSMIHRWLHPNGTAGQTQNSTVAPNANMPNSNTGNTPSNDNQNKTDQKQQVNWF